MGATWRIWFKNAGCHCHYCGNLPSFVFVYVDCYFLGLYEHNKITIKTSCVFLLANRGNVRLISYELCMSVCLSVYNVDVLWLNV